MDKIYNLRDRRITMLPALAAIILAFFCTAVSSGFSEELEFLTWADYIDPELVAEFEQETGIHIKFSYYESDDARDEILSSNTAGAMI